MTVGRYQNSNEVGAFQKGEQEDQEEVGMKA
jgi:hypothetical protein